jgi:amino acid adenylation domain-containing protein
MDTTDKRKNIETIYPLSPMQQGMLFHTLLSPQAGTYVPQVCFTLEGDLNIDTLRQCWQAVLLQHPALRTAFYWEQRDKPFQIVFRQVTLPWEYQDWRNIFPEQHSQQLQNFLQRDRQAGFDLKTPPLMRLALIQRSDTQFYLIWAQHHLLLDGWSAALVINDVFRRYYSGLGSPSPRPYRDYIAWLDQQDQGAAKAFWQNYLSGFTSSVSFYDRALQTKQFQPNEQRQTLSLEDTAALQSFARQHQLTLNTVVQGAFALLLSRYSSATDVVFGATSSGRPATLKGVESMVGLFINTLPVRVQVNSQVKLVPWLQNIQLQQAEASQYEYSALLDVQEWSDIASGASLFDSILVFENYPVEAASSPDRTLKISEIRSIEWTSFPITVLVSGSTKLSIGIKYDQAHQTPDEIAQLLKHFCTLLTEMVAQPEQRITDFSILTVSEQQQQLNWNQTQADYPQTCIHTQFEQQVERSPDAIAVQFEQDSLTYRELNARANQLAHCLRDLGVQPEIPVGVCLERSLWLVISLIAILKAGGTYVPLDPSYPEQRLELVISEVQAPIVLTQSKLSKKIPQYRGKIIDLDIDLELIQQQPSSNLTNQTDIENAIYILYTSGSTGVPKGVINTHRGISNRLAWMQQEFQLKAHDRVLQKTPFSFDVSVWEFFWTLLNGACLVVSRPNGHQDTAYLVELIDRAKITTIHFVPSMLQAFLEEPDLSKCSSLKRIICSGEALPTALQNHCLERLAVDLYNLYGPTEAAIDVTSWKCHPSQTSVPIGYPIYNTQIYLLDHELRPVPFGVPGELYIGGDGLARGYWNRPDLSAERFIPNPFTPGHRLYKTGDRARHLSRGEIEYLGRLDNQIKLRGFRIELEEIETTLRQAPEVKEALVTLYDPDNPRLVAYLTPASLSVEDLRHFLAAKLPSYAIPSNFILCDRFPLTPNGKLDRKALPNPDRISATRTLPRNPTEEIIAAIWTTILKTEEVGIEDNFFDLGGNSLFATRVNSRLREAFQLDLPLSGLFEHPTIAELAEQIHALQKTIHQLQSIPQSTGRKEIEL